MGEPKRWFGWIILPIFLIALSVPARGTVRLAFDSTGLDFGNVALSGAHELIIETWDTALVPVEINQLSIITGQSDFSIISPTPPVVLNPGTVHTQIIIRFSPQAFGNRSGQLLIETTDGNVIIPLSGFGSGGPNLSWAITNIDFGSLPPGGIRDTSIELYSTGTSPAIVSDIVVGESDTAFEAQFANSILPPITLAPGDSIAVQILFQGLPLTGVKNAQLIAIGNLVNNPSCNLIGNDTFGHFATLPSPTIDFGVMYGGQVVDSTIQLVNTGNVDLLFEDLEISPSGDDFTLLNPPQLPFTLYVGDTLSLFVEANPGVTSSHRAYLQLVSQQSDTNYKEDTITVSVIQPPVKGPLVQTLSYPCAIASPIADTIPISNAGSQSVVITSVGSNNPNIILQSNVSFPDTISSGITQPVLVRFTPTSSELDTLVLALMGGTQVMLMDTLALHSTPSQATASLTAIAATGLASQGIEIGAVNGLTAFNLDSIIVHLSVQNSNVAAIDPATIALAPGVANAQIASVQQELNGYAVTIASTTPIAVPVGNPLLLVSLDRFVSNTNSTDVTVTMETPQLTGCLSWSADSTTVSGLNVCGSTELEHYLSGNPMSVIALLRNNPVSGQDAEISLTASQIGDTRYELINALGEMLCEGSFHLAPGVNDCKLPMQSVPTGVYTVRLIPESGIATTLRFIKID